VVDVQRRQTAVTKATPPARLTAVVVLLQPIVLVDGDRLAVSQALLLPDDVAIGVDVVRRRGGHLWPGRFPRRQVSLRIKSSSQANPTKGGSDGSSTKL
jgi:hypothetical protein